METDFCVEALEEALAKHGKPEIFNTDQGSQFTSEGFTGVTGVLIRHGVAISMDGKGSWRDNVFVERLWRSVKYEQVYPHAYDSVFEARAARGRYVDFYNRRRPHSSLDARTPDEAYFASRTIATAARAVARDFDAALFGLCPPAAASKSQSPAFSITRQEST